jgi:hypothetical protein
MTCEDSIIAMDKGSVKRLSSPEQSALVGTGPLERRNSLIRSGRYVSNQCSALVCTG